MVNTPHNPSGAVFSRQDVDALADLAERHDLFVLGDEVYEHMVFDGALHQSLLRHDALYRRSFVVSSFGKTYHATGWKIGYCIAPPELTVEFRKVHQFVQFAVTAPMQAAIADFLTENPAHHRELPAFYQRKRDHFLRLLAATRLRAVPSAGTYFQLADYSGVSDEPDTEFVRRLTTETGVAAIPVSVFSTGLVQRAPRAVLFCKTRRDARRGGRATAQALIRWQRTHSQRISEHGGDDRHESTFARHDGPGGSGVAGPAGESSTPRAPLRRASRVTRT
jgi:methionine aminotransferase